MISNLERVLASLENLYLQEELTGEEYEFAKKELSEGIIIGDNEELGIGETGTLNHEGEPIREVVLTNGDMERHVCFI